MYVKCRKITENFGTSPPINSTSPQSNPTPTFSNNPQPSIISEGPPPDYLAMAGGVFCVLFVLRLILKIIWFSLT